MSCSSEGWYPEPRLRWSDLKEGLTPNVVKFNEDPSGLRSVHSWVLVSSSSEVSCSVGLSGEEEKESRVRLDHRPKPAQQGSYSVWFDVFIWEQHRNTLNFFDLESAGSAAGWMAFALLLVAVLIVFGVLCYKKRGKCFILEEWIAWTQHFVGRLDLNPTIHHLALLGVIETSHLGMSLPAGPSLHWFVYILYLHGFVFPIITHRLE